MVSCFAKDTNLGHVLLCLSPAICLFSTITLNGQRFCRNYVLVITASKLSLKNGLNHSCLCNVLISHNWVDLLVIRTSLECQHSPFWKMAS